MTTTSHGACGSRPNQSPMAAFARSSDACATAAISSRRRKWSAGSSRSAFSVSASPFVPRGARPARSNSASIRSDLLQADGVDFFRRDVERGVRPREQRVRLVASGNVRQPRTIVGRARGAISSAMSGPIALERRPDLLADDAEQVVPDLRDALRRLGERPLGVGLRQQLVELLEDLGGRGSPRRCGPLPRRAAGPHRPGRGRRAWRASGRGAHRPRRRLRAGWKDGMSSRSTCGPSMGSTLKAPCRRPGRRGRRAAPRPVPPHGSPVVARTSVRRCSKPSRRVRHARGPGRGVVLEAVVEAAIADGRGEAGWRSR